MLPPSQSQQPPPFSTLSASQNPNPSLFPFSSSSLISLSSSPWDPPLQNPNSNPLMHIKTENPHFSPPPFFQPPPLFTNHSKGLLNTNLPFSSSDTGPMSTSRFLSATSLLQKATTIGAVGPNTTMSAMMNGFDELGAMPRHVGPPTTADMAAVLQSQSKSPSTTNTTTSTTTNNNNQSNNSGDHYSAMLATWRKNNDGLTRDFLGLTAGDYNTSGGGDEVVGNMLKFTGGLQYGMTAAYDRDNSSSLLLKPQQQPLVHQNQHHNHHHHHHQEVEGFGFVAAAEPPTTAAAASRSRWG